MAATPPASLIQGDGIGEIFAVDIRRGARLSNVPTVSALATSLTVLIE